MATVPRTLAFVGAAALAAVTAGCLGPATSMEQARQVATQFNADTRFERAQDVIEHVAAASRSAFAERRRAWGSDVRIADVEMMGLRPKGDAEAVVTVRVAWYRIDQQELRFTTLGQTWREMGDWKLVDEKRLDGDIGLLGEVVVYASPNDGRPPAQFPTVRLGGAGAP